MAPPSSPKVDITAPDFALQKKLGVPAKCMPVQRLQKADAAVGTLSKNFDALRANFLETLKFSQSSAEQIYETAHEFRGIAGSYQRRPQGKIADALCRYIDAARAGGRAPEASVVTTLKNALLACETASLNDPQTCQNISEAACEAALKKIEHLKRT